MSPLQQGWRALQQDGEVLSAVVSFCVSCTMPCVSRIPKPREIAAPGYCEHPYAIRDGALK